ncbi:MAG TPA: glycosyltransferase family 1 protein [Thermoanaerobaculia bacterium]|nr:glycosyltransferase family 1 protein [Thermoanaerobaculia bacterium]
MRVAIDCRKLADFGIGTYIRGLIGELARIGGGEEYIAVVPSRAVHLVPEPMRPLIVDAPNYRLRELWVVARAIERAGADVFHAPHINIPLTDRPTIATLHDVIPLHVLPRWRPEYWYASLMTNRAARKSAVVLTVSEASKRALVETIGCPAEKIVVTPNGVEEIFFDPGPRNESYGDYVLYAGNDKPHKNLRGVLAAFELLRRDRPSLQLVVAGVNVRSLRGRAGVHLTGFVSLDELMALYRGARVALLPSFEEGFGLPALEAMAAGTPAVVSATPALLEVTGDAALHVDPSSPEDIAAGVDRILCDAALDEDLRRRGPMQARKFTWRRCAEMTRRVYEDVYRSARSGTRW